MSNSNPTPYEVLYRETVWPSLFALLPAILLAPAVGLVITPFTDYVVATLVGSSVFVLALVVVLSLAPKIVVMQSDRKIFLQVNSANIEASHISSAQVIAKGEARAERGPKLDARSFRVFQPSVSEMLKVNLSDERDSTPYWLVSTRNPVALKAALKK
ncbi:MAG: hypothetical protein RL719_10 [Actinomycetota bacterium]